MQIYTEREAEKFLAKEGFDVIETDFFKGEKDLDDFLKSVEFPIVMKASGDKIIHKKSIGAVKLNLLDYGSSIQAFEELMKIESAEGVVVQKQISGKEILLGIKKTPEFGPVLVFGQGGSLVEKIADVSFRVCPIEKRDLVEMISETKMGKTLNEKEIKIIVENLIRLGNLVEKNSEIKELDINPLILTSEEKGVIVDARISWD